MGMLLAFSFALFAACSALECEIHLNDEYKDVISKCYGSNSTLENLWDSSEESKKDSSSEEEEPWKIRPKRSEKNDTDEASTCIVHCVFEDLKLVDSNGYPDHGLLAEALLKNATGRHLRDFIQDVTDECFQEVNKDEESNCGFSTKLVMCMSEKGKHNCADWPVANPPF